MGVRRRVKLKRSESNISSVDIGEYSYKISKTSHSSVDSQIERTRVDEEARTSNDEEQTQYKLETTKTDEEIKKITILINELQLAHYDKCVSMFNLLNSIAELSLNPPIGAERVVKLGRTCVGVPSTLAHHWAVQIGESWYEITPKDKETRQNNVRVSDGRRAKSFAGLCGGEVVGLTTVTDGGIKAWYKLWLDANPEYNLFTDNCQKFAYQLMDWVTYGKFLCEHRVISADMELADIEMVNKRRGFVAKKGGNIVAHWKYGKDILNSWWCFSTRYKIGHFTAQAVAGPGLGLFLDAIFVDRAAYSGNLVGIHVGLNLNTGLGIRNGNFEAQLLGCGGKIGADGIEVNTSLGGINACSLM